MLEPVVVNPETVSKKQSIKFGISRLIKNGSAPKSDIASQDRETIAKTLAHKYIALLGLYHMHQLTDDKKCRDADSESEDAFELVMIQRHKQRRKS